MPVESPKHDSQKAILELLGKYKLIENLVHKQDMPRHELIESLVHRENIARLQRLVNQLPPAEVAALLEQLPPEHQLIIWDQLEDARKQPVLLEAPLSVLQILGSHEQGRDRMRIKAFHLQDGYLREITFTNREELVVAQPMWIDLITPTFEDRMWLGGIFNLELPDPGKLSDLESSARFYIEEDGGIHLHSDFLLDKHDHSRNVPVALVLYKNILFSMRNEELPVFRLQRLRALTQRDYVKDARDFLLDLYAADVEYSAGALEEIYLNLEKISSQVLRKDISDEEAARILGEISQEEDLNGRIRRNVLDTRRAISFLVRSRVLDKHQLDETQQIIRDIESLDGHTAFLFDKINFLMDATVGFININQNKMVKRLSLIGVVFMPLNVIAGIGGMSEFSMMTHGIPWPLAYSALLIVMLIVAWLTIWVVRLLEKRRG